MPSPCMVLNVYAQSTVTYNVRGSREKNNTKEIPTKMNNFYFTLRLQTFAQASDRHLTAIQTTKVANDTGKTCRII